MREKVIKKLSQSGFTNIISQWRKFCQCTSNFISQFTLLQNPLNLGRNKNMVSMYFTLLLFPF